MYMDEIPQLVPPSVSSADAMDEEEDSTPFSVSLSSTNEIINFAFFFLSTNRFTVNYLGFFSSEGLWQLVLGRPIGARHPSRPLRPRQLIASFSVNCFFFLEEAMYISSFFITGSGQYRAELDRVGV